MKKEHMKHHFGVLIALALIAVLSVVLIISDSATAAGPGDTFASAYGTYEYVMKDDTNVDAGTYSYGTASVIVLKQASSFVVWADSAIPATEDAFIIAAVSDLDKSLANATGAVTRLTSFNMKTVLNTNANQLDVVVNIDTTAHTFTLGDTSTNNTKGISHYTLFKFKPFKADLTIDKDVTGANASASEPFSITVTFSGTNLGSITNNAGLSGTNGVYTFTLSGSATPVKFSKIPYGTSYTVTETVSGAQATAGWAYTSGAVTTPVELNGSNKSPLVTITNTYTPTASLTVDKTVTGKNASGNEAFSITVTFTGTSLGGITNNAGLTGINDVYTFMLSGSGTPVTFSNIPYGTSYTVTETVSGAQTTAGWAKADPSGEVTSAVELNENNTSDTVTIENNYTQPTASLTIDKTVTGANASTSELFSITVTFTGSDLGDIVYSGGVNNPTGVYTFQLSGDSTPVTFTKIPYGTEYTVTESLGIGQTDWMIASGTVEQMVMLSSENTSDTVEIINNYGPTASLIVDKTVNDGASTSEEFSITVKFYGDNLTNINYSGGDNIPSGEYTFNLSAEAGQAIFSNIPYGTQYTVTEAVSGSQASAGWAKAAPSGEVIEKITLDNANKSDTVTIENIFTPAAALTIDKSVNEGASTSEKFSITVTFTGEDVSGIENNATPTLTGENGVYTFELSAGSSPVTFSKIPYGTQYTVTETVSSAQVALGWSSTPSGVVTNMVTLDVENPDDTVEIVNTFTPSAKLVVDKSVLGENASTSEPFTITVTFTGNSIGGIVNNANLNGTNGVYTFPLSAGSTPVEFSLIPYGTTYTVTEVISSSQTAAGWAYAAGAVTQAVQLNEENPDDTVNIVNNYGPTASLVIDKTVTGAGASTSEAFSITVTFSGDNLTDIDYSGGDNVSSGEYTFNLSAGAGQVTFSNIPYGTTYTVNESISDSQANNGWAYSSGKVTEPVVLNAQNPSGSVTLVNSFTPQTPPPPPPPVIENGTLTVTKNVSGAGASTTAEFAVTVQFSAPFGGISNNAGLTGTGGVYTLSLMNNESVTFTNIPLGVTYTITETLTADQAVGGWTAPNPIEGIINNAVLVAVTVENVFTETGVAGDSDGEVAGDTDTLPQTGGISFSTLLGIMGLTLAASGGIVVFIFRKHRYNSGN